jgi:nucleoside-diphosphate-sugar epimerase
MPSVLVTGASGFIGTHLTSHLRSLGYTVIEWSRPDGDVADEANWRTIEPTDAVVHLAARSFVPESWSVPAEFARTNVLGAVNALEHCRKHNEHLIFLSSYLYGQPTTLPISETAPIQAPNPYALSKKLAEEACEFYADQFGVDVTVLRPFNVYGPGQADDFLVPSLLRQIARGDEIVVQDLEPRRDYVYVLDLVYAIANALSQRGGRRVVNIGTGVSHSVEELIRVIQATWQSSLPVRSKQQRRKSEIDETVASIDRAERLLAWRPRFTLEAGLQHMRSLSSAKR